MKKELIQSLFWLLAPLCLQAQIKAYPIDAWHSKIGFSVPFSGLLDVTGRFTSFKGTVLMDEADLSKTSASVIIEVESIDTGVDLRDEHLRDDGFFDAEKYPKITFVSERTFQQEGTWVMEGNLEIRGVSKKVQIPFELVHGEALDSWKNFRITLRGELSINRLDFGVGNPKETVGEEVKLELLVSARVFNTATINLFERPFGKTMVEALESGGLEAARTQYESLQMAEDKDTGSAFNFTFLYLHLQQKGNLSAALKAAQLGVELFPEKSASFGLLGYAYYENGEHRKAVDSFRRALELNERNTLAMEMLKWMDK